MCRDNLRRKFIMGSNEVNGAGISKGNVNNFQSDKKLTAEEKAKLEKQTTAEEIRNYYKKNEEHQATLDMMRLNEQQERLARKAQELQKHYSSEQVKGHDFSDITGANFDSINLDEIKKLEAELEQKKLQMEAEQEAKALNAEEQQQGSTNIDYALQDYKDKSMKKLEQLESEIAAQKEQVEKQNGNLIQNAAIEAKLSTVNTAISKLKADISSKRAEITSLLEAGNTEELAEKEVELAQLETQLDILKAEQQRYKAEKEQQEIDALFKIDGNV